MWRLTFNILRDIPNGMTEKEVPFTVTKSITDEVFEPRSHYSSLLSRRSNKCYLHFVLILYLKTTQFGDY